MKQFTERQTIMISKKQAESLQILKTYDVNVSQFIFNNLAYLLKKIRIKVYTYNNYVYFYFIK